MVAKEKRPLTCACGSGLAYADCCSRYHSGTFVPNGEVLMRSRYTAYAMGIENYLLDTWHPSTRPASLDFKSSPQTQWIGLQVISHQRQDIDHATVEFIARCKINGQAFRMQEISRFVREGERWFYVDGKQAQD